MKRLLPLLPCAVLLAGAAPARAEGAEPDAGDAPRIGVEVRVGGVILDKDYWDDSVGAMADVGLTLWTPDGILGLWAGLGGESATLKWTDPWGTVESDVTAVPVGGSLLLHCGLLPGFAVRAEAGVRYVFTDIDDWDDDHYRRRYRRDDEWDRYHHPDRYLDVDDTAFAIAALQFEIDVAPLRIGVGGGYQFDLRKADVEYLDRPIGKVDFSGAIVFVDIGLVF